MTKFVRSPAAGEVVAFGKELHLRGWIASCDGNISYLDEKGQVCITPAGRHKGYLDGVELATVTREGVILAGTPSSERSMHLEIYRACPEARAVIHAHPPLATAWSIAKPQLKELPSGGMSELILAVGRIPIVPYQRPGTDEMASALRPFLPECRVLILAHHGAVAWGESLEEAYSGIERLEHAARVLYYAEQLGGVNCLPEEELEFLRAKRRAGPQRIF